jgi:hypothetical protein
MLISFLSLILKMAGLVYLISIERVIGLPWIYLLLSLVWIAQIQSRRGRLKLVLISLFFSLLLSTTYDLAWSLSLTFYTFGLFYLKFGQKLVKSQRRRFIIAVIAINLIITWVSSIRLSHLSLIQFVASYLLVILWMRVLKVEKINKSRTLSIRLINEKN